MQHVAQGDKDGKYECEIKRQNGQVQWLIPVITTLWEVEAGGSFEVRSLWPAWPTWWNPISTKIFLKISQAWWWMPIIPDTREAEAGESIAWAWEMEVVASREHATAFQPGWQSKNLPQKKKEINKQNFLKIYNLLSEGCYLETSLYNGNLVSITPYLNPDIPFYWF